MKFEKSFLASNRFREPFVIAELCQNHLGKTKNLKIMVRKAAKSGAAIVKIQDIQPKMVTFRQKFESGSEKHNFICRPYADEKKRMSHLRLCNDQYKLFIQECYQQKVIPMVTCFTKDSPKKMFRLGFRWVKVASYDCGALPFLKQVKKYFKNIIVSTGTANQKEILQTARLLGPCLKYILHCDSIYPTPFESVNFGKMKWLSQHFQKIGFSDHTCYEKDELKAALCSRLLNCVCIERHFTILGKEKTKDGPVSLNPSQLSILSKKFCKPKSQIRKIIGVHHSKLKKMLNKKPSWQLTRIEKRNRNYYRGRFAASKNGRPDFNWE